MRPEDRERTPEEIQAEIALTRAAIQEDVKAIGEKFTPEHIKESAKGVLSDMKQEGVTMIREAKDAAVDSLRSKRDHAIEAVSETAHELGERARQVGITAGGYARKAGVATGDFVTANAIPLSLLGIGAAWLALSMRKQRQLSYLQQDKLVGYHHYYDEQDDRSTAPRGGRAKELVGSARSRVQGVAERAQGAAESAAERVGALSHAARERVGSVAERASQSIEVARTRAGDAATHLSVRTSELSHEARERLCRAQLRTRDFADENPLAVGAIAIAAGVGVGLLLPHTQPENRLMGETRDRLIGDARELVNEARDAGGRVAQKARETARDVRSSVSERISH